MAVSALYKINFTPSPLELELRRTVTPSPVEGESGKVTWFVTLTGDHEKVLYEGLDRTKAQKMFDSVKADYVAREAAEKA